MDEVPVGRLIEQVEESLDQERVDDLRTLLEDVHPSDIAILVDHLEDDRKAKLLLLLDDEVAADVLLKVDAESLDHILTALSTQEMSQLVAQMEPNEATDVIAELSIDAQKQIISLLPREEAEKVSELLPYDPDTAGGIMNTNFIAVLQDATVGEVLEQIRRRLRDSSVSDFFYVTDWESRLVGTFSLRSLVISETQEKVGEVMDREVVAVSVHDDQEEVAHVVSKYDLVVVPVVDRHSVLKGIVTADDVMDVLQDEATEDIMRMAGTDVTESPFTSPPKAAMKRLPWLYLNLGTAFIAALVVGLFRESISSVVALAVFMPIIAAMGGNAGTQTLAVVVRSIALGEVTLGDVRRILLKEMMVGILTGVGIGIISSAIAYVWNGSFLFGMLVGVSLIVNLFMACAVGALIPMMLRRFRVDPALASSVFLITLTDCIGFFVFLGLATLFLEGLRG
jgi:magnesium transporter